MSPIVFEQNTNSVDLKQQKPHIRYDSAVRYRVTTHPYRSSRWGLIRWTILIRIPSAKTQRLSLCSIIVTLFEISEVGFGVLFFASNFFRERHALLNIRRRVS